MEEFFFSRCSFFGWVLYLITSVLSTVVFRRALSFQLLESKQICKIKNQSSQYRNYPKTWFQEKHKLIHSSHPIIAYHCHSLILLLKIAPTTISSAVRGEWRKTSLVHLADQCPSINHPCMLSLLYFGCRCWSRGKGIRLSRLLILLYCTNVFCVSHLASLFLDSWSSTNSLCVNGSWFHLALVFAVVKNLKLNWIEIVLSSTSLLKRRQWLKELLSFSVQAYCHLQLHDRLILFSSFYQGQATWKVGVTSHIHNHMKTLYFLCFNLLNFDIFMIMFLSVWKFAWGTDTHGFVGIPRNIEFVSSFWLRSSRSTLIADSWRVCFN